MTRNPSAASRGAACVRGNEERGHERGAKDQAPRIARERDQHVRPGGREDHGQGELKHEHRDGHAHPHALAFHPRAPDGIGETGGDGQGEDERAILADAREPGAGKAGYPHSQAATA